MSQQKSNCLLILAIFLVNGCSDSGGRVEISGTVSLQGKPIKDGAILMFEPMEGQDTAGTVTTTGGAFSIPRTAGLKPGKYLVRVTLGDGVTAVNPVNPDEGPGPAAKGSSNIISKELIPPEWNINSKQQVTISKEGPNKFEFKIP